MYRTCPPNGRAVLHCKKRPHTNIKMFVPTNVSAVPRTNAPTGRVDRNWTKPGGKAP